MCVCVSKRNICLLRCTPRAGQERRSVRTVYGMTDWSSEGIHRYPLDGWKNKNKKPTVSLSQWFTATWLCKAHDREGGSLHASISMWAGGSRAGQCVVLLLSFGVHALLYTLSHGWIQSHEGMRNGQGRGENITLASDETNVHDTKVSFVIPFYLYLLHKPDGCRSSMFRHIRTRPLSGMPSPAGATSSTV